MRQLRLTAKTRHGQNKITLHGDTWVVVSVSAHVPCLEAPGIYIQSTRTLDKRWICQANDKHFAVEEIADGLARD